MVVPRLHLNSWLAASDDLSNLTFDVYLDTNSNPTTLVANDITALSYTPTSSQLAKGLKVYWKVVATDSSGSVTSSIQSFTVGISPDCAVSLGDNSYSVSRSANGDYFVTGSENGKINLFNNDSCTAVWSYEASDEVRSVDISANGKYIVAGSNDDKTYLFNNSSNTPIWTFSDDADVEAVAISADGNYIITGNVDGDVHLFSKDSNSYLWRNNQGSKVRQVDISGDGEYLVSAHTAGKAYIYGKDSRIPINSLIPHLVQWTQLQYQQMESMYHLEFKMVKFI